MAQSVTRAAHIIEEIAGRPTSVADLAARFDVHRTTMFRELVALENVGFARRRADGTWALGLRLIELGQAALLEIDVRAAAAEHARRLHAVVGNTVHIAAVIEDSIVYVDKVEDAHSVRMYSRIGSPVRPQCSAIGKVVLADMPVARRDDFLRDVEWTRHTATTITSREEFDRALERAAADGYAIDDGEYEDFVNCVAVPIRTSVGTVGALSLTALRMVEGMDQVRARLPMLRETASAIARELA